jgi:hypothetical protein
LEGIRDIGVSSFIITIYLKNIGGTIGDGACIFAKMRKGYGQVLN